MTDLRRLAEQRAPNNRTASRVNYRDGKAILALLDERDSWERTAWKNLRTYEADREAAERRVASLEEGLRHVTEYCNDPKVVAEARALLAAAPDERCDQIVNNGMGEPTECGRTLPCEYHDPAAPSEPIGSRRTFADGSPGVPAALPTKRPASDE